MKGKQLNRIKMMLKLKEKDGVDDSKLVLLDALRWTYDLEIFGRFVGGEEEEGMPAMVEDELYDTLIAECVSFVLSGYEKTDGNVVGGERLELVSPASETTTWLASGFVVK